MSEKQTEAQRLADALEQGTYLLSVERDATASELRRLDAENTSIRKCAIKYLEWLNITNPEAAFSGDILDPEMTA